MWIWRLSDLWVCENISICGMRMPPHHHHHLRHKGHVCPLWCATSLAAIVPQSRPLTSVTNLLTFRFLERGGGQRQCYTCRRRKDANTSCQCVLTPTMATVWCCDGGWRRQQTRVDRKWRIQMMGLRLLRRFHWKVKHNILIRGRCSEAGRSLLPFEHRPRSTDTGYTGTDGTGRLGTFTCISQKI